MACSRVLLGMLAVVLGMQIVHCAGTYSEITADQAYELLVSNPAVFLLDVRTPSEYESGHIGGALLIPNYELSSRLSELPLNRSAPILVYCLSGGRSATSSELIVAGGYTQVYNMLGGTSAWKVSGYPLVMGPEPGVFQAGETGILLLAGAALLAWLRGRGAAFIQSYGEQRR